ncbi:MAG: YbaN family protein [Planctomycetota bacterium]
MPDAPTDTPIPLRRRRVERWLLAAAGVVCVGLGAAGVFVPGLPTTVFLIVASACFVRSCPRLEDALLRNRLFAPYMKYVDGRTPMPMKARVAAVAMMWACVGLSLTLLAAADRLPIWLAVVIAATAAVGTAFAFRWRARVAAPASA